jgi:flagellar hook assembly protein FlgD
VRLLHSGPLLAGPHSFGWDGRDERGRERPSGTYLLHLDAGGTRDVRKLQLLR